MKMGSAMWHWKYRMQRQPWRFILPLVVLVTVVFATLWMIGEEGEPADARTVGQAVIDGWVYGGLDSDGNLIFQQGDQVVLLPKGSREVKLNGKRATIIRSTADTIQIGEEQEDHGSGTFTALFWLSSGIVIGWWIGRPKRSHPPYRGAQKMKRWNRTRFVR